MVISNDMDAAEQSGVIRVDEADHFSESWTPPFEHRDGVKVRKSEKFSDFYDLYECIGEGKFGKVYRCVEKATQLTLAAKTIRIKRDADRAQIENEVAIMTQMKHKCIAQIYDAFQTSSNDVILIMEIVEGGELFDRVADDSFILTELAVAMILHQLCEAIAYIHSQNIIHLDLKPENIMCISLESNQIKLIDFGLAQHFDGQSDLLFMAGTPEFAAPEVIKFEPLDFHTDMWSVGVITYILLSGQSPFLGTNVALTYNNVERGEWSFCEEFDENGISEAARDFISKLLVVDKSKRMLPNDCLQHSWIVECRKRAARSSQEKPLDTGKLRSYVRNKHFRRLVFGVLFINTVLKMMNTMQERKSANGMAYVKTMYHLAGRKNCKEEEVKPSTSQEVIHASTEISLEPEHQDGFTSVSIPNDGTPKVLESIRMEKRRPSKKASKVASEDRELPTKVKRKPDTQPIVNSAESSRIAEEQLLPKATQNSRPKTLENGAASPKKVTKKQFGSVESIVTKMVQRVDSNSSNEPKLSTVPTAAPRSQVKEASISVKTEKPKSTVHTIKEKMAKAASAMNSELSASPGKKTVDVKTPSSVKEKSVPVATNAASLKTKVTTGKQSLNIDLNTAIISHNETSSKPAGLSQGVKPSPIAVVVDKAKILVPQSTTLITKNRKSKTEKLSKSSDGSAESVSAKVTGNTSNSAKAAVPISDVVAVVQKNNNSDKPPIPRRTNPQENSESKAASSTKSKELGSVESIVFKVVEKVSQDTNALSALPKCSSKKVERSPKGSSTTLMPSTALVKESQKQPQSVSVKAEEHPRTQDALVGSNIRAIITEPKSLDIEQQQRNTVSMIPEKKTTTESRTKVTNRTIKRQTSTKKSGVEENESMEETMCKIKHTTTQQTDDGDTCKTVIGKGQFEASKRNVQKATTEADTGIVKTISGKQELHQRKAFGVLSVTEDKARKTEASGIVIDAKKTAKIEVSSGADKVVVDKIRNNNVETTRIEALQKKELRTKKSSVGPKSKLEDSGFTSDGEPCHVKKTIRKVHRSTDNLLDADSQPKPLTKKNVTFSKELLDNRGEEVREGPNLGSGFSLMKTKSETALHKKRLSVDLAKSSNDICSSAGGKPRVSVPTTDDEYSFANLRKQLENRIEQQKSGHMWKSSTELRFTSTNSSNAKRAMNKWLSMEKNLLN
ncbi:hypothetical protein QR680_002182 [Steinernema hermaphroditum]|uniref:Protein kinase domain-containing protein n=1 Tax=Steinernema hermaphroditum TaxID=289476 RepID=A0AA39H1P0_9BILA|nr:hypothetical protein QR680_002182 [Steinernema hermaphroditum]